MRKSDKTKGELYDSRHDEIALWLYQNLKDEAFLKNELKVRPELKIRNIEVGLEVALYMAQEKFKNIRGYLDVMVKFEYWDGESMGEDHHGGKTERYEAWNTSWYGFEVKIKVNVGETIRQLKTYQTYCLLNQNRLKRIFLVSPKTPHAEIFKEQGFSVIEYPCDSLS